MAGGNKGKKKPMTQDQSRRQASPYGRHLANGGKPSTKGTNKKK